VWAGPEGEPPKPPEGGVCVVAHTRFTHSHEWVCVLYITSKHNNKPTLVH